MASRMRLKNERASDMPTTQRDRCRAPTGRRMSRCLWMEGIIPNLVRGLLNGGEAWWIETYRERCIDGW